MSRIKFWVKIHVLSRDLPPNLNQKDLASVFKSNSTRIEYFPSMKRILARIAISQIQPFSNFAGIRNRFLYQICHFRFLEILAPIFHHSSFPHIAHNPRGADRRFSANLDCREDWSLNVKDSAWRKDPIHRKRPDPICWDLLELDCNPREPMLISLTGIANLFNHFMRSEPANSCSCFTRINREKRIESPFLD